MNDLTDSCKYTYVVMTANGIDAGFAQIEDARSHASKINGKVVTCECMYYAELKAKLNKRAPMASDSTDYISRLAVQWLRDIRAGWSYVVEKDFS